MRNNAKFPWIFFETCYTFKELQKNDLLIIQDPTTLPLVGLFKLRTCAVTLSPDWLIGGASAISIMDHPG